jgi:hypothetical protein
VGAVRRGSYVSRSEAESKTLKDILERYITDVLPTKRGGTEDAIRLASSHCAWFLRVISELVDPKSKAFKRCIPHALFWTSPNIRAPTTR